MAVRSEVAQNLAGISQSLVTSVAQLRVHRAMVRHWGYSKLETLLNGVYSSRSSDLDGLLSSILSAEGTPDLQGINRLNIGQTVEEIFQSESRTASELKEMVAETILAWPAFDLLTADSLQKMALSLAEQNLLFDQGLELIRQMGSQNFLATRC